MLDGRWRAVMTDLYESGLIAALRFLTPAVREENYPASSEDDKASCQRRYLSYVQDD